MLSELEGLLVMEGLEAVLSGLEGLLVMEGLEAVLSGLEGLLVMEGLEAVLNMCCVWSQSAVNVQYNAI